MEEKMKFAFSLGKNLDANKLIAEINKILEEQSKKEGSLENSLLVISVAKAVDGQFATLSSPL